jgi:hypothetical protein
MRTALKLTEMVHASFVNAALSEDRTKLASSMISVSAAESADSQPEPVLVEPDGSESLARKLPSTKKSMDDHVVLQIPGLFQCRFEQIEREIILRADM